MGTVVLCYTEHLLTPPSERLARSQHLGIHSEMFSDGVLSLVKSGVITGSKKTRETGKLVSTFLIGSQVGTAVQ